MEENGKQKKAQSPMDVELRAIRRVARAIDGMSLAQRERIINYVQRQVWDEMNLGPGQGLVGVAQSRRVEP